MSKKLSRSQKDLALSELATTASVIETWHEHDVYLPSRTIYIGSTVAFDYESGVDARMAEAALKNLHLLEYMGDGPITIVMNNPGGDWYHGIAIYDAVKGSPCEITIKARGYVMSMGSIIMQAAKKRMMSPTATQMVHYGTDGYQHHSKTFQRYAEQSKKINEIMEGIYLQRIREKHPQYTLARLKKLLDFDTYLTPQESIDLGLADEIG